MSPLAKPYATALFEVMEKKAKTHEALQALLKLSEVLKENQEILGFLKSPLISIEDKKKLLNEFCCLEAIEGLENFFGVLIDNNRFEEFFDVIKVFETINSKKLGFIPGVVDSAVELNDSEKKGVEKTIENHLSCQVKLQFMVKPEMIGGIEARAGGCLFEDSIKFHVKRLSDFVIRRV